MRRALLAALVAGLVVVPAAAAHVRYAGCEGYCEYFNGNTVRPEDNTTPIDPINVVWFPWGSAGQVRYVLNNQIGWTHECGSNQNNRRLLGSMSGGLYYAFAQQNVQQASSGCPNPAYNCWYVSNCDRWHTRIFTGHSHDLASNNWSAAGVHHENNSHDIDTSWEVAESTMASRAANAGHAYEHYWTYLPRAAGPFQGYHSDGYAVRINAG